MRRMREAEVTTTKILKQPELPEETFMKTETIEIDEQSTLDLDEQLEVDISLTENLGNFRSLRVGIKLSIPTSTKRREKDYELTKKWIQTHIKEEMSDVVKR